MLSLINHFIAFFSKYSKIGYIVGTVAAIMLSIITAFFTDRHQINEKIAVNQETTVLNTNNISMLKGQVEVLEGDSKTKVNRTAFNHYIDHSDKERDTQASLDWANQKELGELIRGQQDIDRLIYHDFSDTVTNPKGN